MSAIYTPQQWKTQAPEKVIISFPGMSSPPQYNQALGSLVTLPTSLTLYAFDAEIDIEHEQRLERTRHPVQTGASISDHSFIIPAELSMNVSMSDAIAAYPFTAAWQGSQSKSVSAYQTMLALQLSRVPLTVTTKLRTYYNMVVDITNPRETFRTFTGLKMHLVFGQIFIAEVTSTPVSARSQDTQNTNLGTVNPQPPTAAQESQNNVSGLSGVPAVPSTAIGAGNWGSNNIDSLGSLPASK